MLTKVTFLLSLFLSLSCLTSYAQDDRAKKQMERYEEEMAKKQAEYIQETIATLNADDFQKQIIKQKMESYFVAKKNILMANLPVHEREAAIANLNETHFLEIKAMVDENTYQQLVDATTLTKTQQYKKKKKKEKASKKKKKSQ